MRILATRETLGQFDGTLTCAGKEYGSLMRGSVHGTGLNIHESWSDPDLGVLVRPHGSRYSEHACKRGKKRKLEWPKNRQIAQTMNV